MADTTIEWCDRVWNPVTGCTKVSPGCAHCYAEGIADRFWSTQYPPVETFPTSFFPDGRRPRAFTDVMTHATRLDQPLRWKKPARIFVNSMSDLFHDDVPDDFIDQAFAVMALAPQHTFQVLTKRAERMRAYIQSRAEKTSFHVRLHAILTNARNEGSTPQHSWPLPNVWLGVSVENQLVADERIPVLLHTPAAVRFISAEPLLGPVNLTRIEHVGPGATGTCFLDVMKGQGCSIGGVWPYGRLDWVIVGGESGPQARPCDICWVRAIVIRCQAAHVPVFVKQLGSDPRDAAAERDDMCARETWPEGWMPTIGGRRVWRPDLSSRKGGDPSEWPEDLRVREFPQ
jgi:protein gp37